LNQNCYLFLPLKYVWNAKDDNTGDDVEKITEGKDSHQVVEIVPLCSEPDDQTGVANKPQNTNQDLGGEESCRGVKKRKEAC
jgi:hypothetical protein